MISLRAQGPPVGDAPLSLEVTAQTAVVRVDLVVTNRKGRVPVDLGGGARRFRKIDVRLKVRGYQVRARRTYFG